MILAKSGSRKAKPSTARAQDSVAMAAFSSQPHYFPQIWLLFASFCVFGLYVGHDTGHLDILFLLDRSRVTWLIAALVLMGSCHVAWHLIVYSQRLRAAGEWPETGITQAQPDSQAVLFLTAWIAENQRDSDPGANTSDSGSSARDDVGDIYADRLRAPVDLGWYLVDVTTRLGLLGTIIGFILIFTSLSDVSIDGGDGLGELLIAMSGGMGTALFTTLAGLVGATLLGVQYLILGRLTEHLLAVLIRLRISGAERVAA